MAGYEVETVPDGLVGVEQALAEPPPDMLVLNIMIPGIDGREACRRIRSNFATSQLPTLIFSALGEEGDAARRAGADAMLKKPFTLPVLGQAVQTLIGP